jgi:hypothetical protein
LDVSNDQGRKILWRKWSVVSEKIGDQEMIVGSITIPIIKDPSGEAVKRGDPERKGENPINDGYRKRESWLKWEQWNRESNR